DDSEALVHAMRLAIEYRQRFERDIFIDLLCYRKYGHNEGDEPRFTQPLLYKAISAHLNPREIYTQKLLSEGIANKQMVDEMQSEFKTMLEADFDESKKIELNVITPFMQEEWTAYPGAEPG
ncbi:MAG TPA: 2-oxoglutarate dehydrogenase E1 component, partial [Cryomorphaceae bacterium]|nr:2-oxoglutarate dehydrogenase E1 component [Cryomorphaceae bacterium]